MDFRKTVVFVLAAAVLPCCYGTPVKVTGKAQPVIQGTVAPPIAEGKVTAYRLDSVMRREEVLSVGATDSDGGFSLDLPSFKGDLLLVVTGGTYSEPAVAAAVTTDGHELTAALVNVGSAANYENVTITPISHLITGLAEHYVTTENQSVADGTNEASEHINKHFGNLNWLQTVPTDLTTSESPQFDESAKAGLILGALSMQARGIGETAGLTPGSGINTIVLTTALYGDLSFDGFFDGVGSSGPILLPPGDATKSYKLDGQTVRLSLALASQRFLGSERNKSPFTDADSRQLRFDLSTNSDSRIFKENGSAYDTQPPQVSLTGDAPPRFTRESTVTVSVLADDGSGTGVHAVFARNGMDSATLSAVKAGGVWTFKDVPIRSGPNRIVIWAEDNATPANSGSGKEAPAEIAVDVTVDTSVPVPAFVPVASYFDERTLSVAQTAGVPSIPAVYNPALAQSRRTLAHQSDVWKVKTRLSWGSSRLTGQELEGENHRNVPFLQLIVAENDASDAPISEVTYSISASCPGCPPITPSTGKLVASARSEPQKVFFDLPLSLETIPSLADLPSSPVSLSITATAHDAAGNTGSTGGPMLLSFHIIGPPIVAWKDVDYGSVEDPRSAFPHKVSDGTYAQAWTNFSTITDNTTGPPHLAVRVVRYMLRNPHSVPVAIRKDAMSAGAWTATERWDRETFALTSNLSEDGFQFDWDYTKNNSPDCSTGQFPIHIVGTSKMFECVPLPYPSNETGSPLSVDSSSTLGLTAFSTPLPKGEERQLAPSAMDASGADYWIVPAAQGNKPGELVAYVERPLHTRTLNWGHFGTNVHFAFRTITWEYYVEQGLFTCPGGVSCYKYRLWRYANKLAAASERVVGNITWRASAIRSDGKPLGDLLVTGSSQFDQTVQH